MLNWVDVVGYRFEIVHTGVLRTLLGQDDSGVPVARGLTGDDRIASVTRLWQEARLRPGSRRAVDLSAALTLADGATGCLAVETKVDSAWTPAQLQASVPEDCHGVLLALGHTALMATDADLAVLDEYSHPWKLVGPRGWSAIVREQTADDPVLSTYADQLEAEADSQDRAREYVRAGKEVDFGRDATALSHWAYFAEVVAELDDTLRWERKTQVSGPLLTLSIPPTWDDGSGAYLELMGEGSRRSLCVKVWAKRGALAARQASVAEGVAGLGGGPGARCSARDKTCTAARWRLEGVLPAQAASLTNRLADALRQLA